MSFFDNLQVVLVKPRFPENVGMAARACANMGCSRLALVEPELWKPDIARPLATPKGIPVLEGLAITDNLQSAVASSQLVYGTTARTGGWRRNCIPPWIAADEITAALAAGERVSLIFGPEDKGLQNAETVLCSKLVHIDTDEGASSLNLAQAVLLVLYECRKAWKTRVASKKESSICCRSITFEERQLFENRFKNILQTLDCLQGKNPDYHFMQWHDLFTRASLRRHEFDALMGLCRQLEIKLNGKQKRTLSDGHSNGE